MCRWFLLCKTLVAKYSGIFVSISQILLLWVVEYKYLLESIYFSLVSFFKYWFMDTIFQDGRHSTSFIFGEFYFWYVILEVTFNTHTKS